jgi:hypothetical protein
LSIVPARLAGTQLPERAELTEVKANHGTDHLDVHPRYRGHEDVRRLKDAVDHGVVPLTGCSLFAYAAFPQRIRDAERIITSTSFYLIVAE